MRVALISDLHANLIALDAVLADIAQLRVDELVCLGDIADLGPSPAAIVSRIRDLGCPTIKGNHDPFDSPLPGPPQLRDVTEWCKEQLSADELAFLRELPMEHSVELDGGHKLLCVHGSPRSFEEGLVADMSAQQLDEALGERRPDVLCGGHTHVQMMRRHGRVTVVNVGSVGAAFASVFTGQRPTMLPWAEYAVVTGTQAGISVDLRRVAYDVPAFAQQIRQSALPGAERWARQWLSSL